MPLFEPTIPANRVPKPKKQRRSKRRRRIGRTRFLGLFAFAGILTVGTFLIFLDRVIVRSGSDWQPNTGAVGVMLIIFGFFCILLGQDDKGNRR